VACVEGKYKPTNGTEDCMQCAPGKYSTVKALASGSMCLSCPAHSFSGGGSTVTNCTCNAGYTGDDGAACVACVGGTFKVATGSSACAPCPNQTVSPSGSVGISECACIAGYSGSGGSEPCLACPLLYHKASTGSSPCIPCISGKVAVRAGSEAMRASTASTECRTVSVGSVFPQGSTTSPFSAPRDVAVSAAGTVATVVQGTSQVVHELSINPSSRVVTHSKQVALSPSTLPTNILSLSYASVGVGSMLRDNTIGDETIILGDVHGGLEARQPSDMLYMPNRPASPGGVNYIAMLNFENNIHPGCSAVASTRSSDVIYCAVTKPSALKNYIVKIAASDDPSHNGYPMSFDFVGAPAGEEIGSIDGAGTGLKLSSPASMCLSPDDVTLYVAEKGAHKIRAINTTSRTSETICGSPGALAGSQDGVGSSARLESPHGIALSADGSTLIIAEAGGHRIRSLDIASRTLTTLAGSSTSAAGLADGDGEAARFSTPSGVAISPDGKVILVADHNNDRVRRLTLA